MARGGEMKEYFFGPLATQIKRHLGLPRFLGFQTSNDTYALRNFDCFLAENFPLAKTVTRSLVVDYLATTSRLTLRTRLRCLSSLRQFCRFLFQLNPDTYIPEP